MVGDILQNQVPGTGGVPVIVPDVAITQNATDYFLNMNTNSLNRLTINFAFPKEYTLMITAKKIVPDSQFYFMNSAGYSAPHLKCKADSSVKIMFGYSETGSGDTLPNDWFTIYFHVKDSGTYTSYNYLHAESNVIKTFSNSGFSKSIIDTQDSVYLLYSANSLGLAQLILLQGDVAFTEFEYNSFIYCGATYFYYLNPTTGITYGTCKGKIIISLPGWYNF
jgi:hypothetical protein